MTTVQRTAPLWQEVEAFYARMAGEGDGQEVQPMLDLVRAIAASPQANGLFPALSDGALLIGRHADFDHGQDVIRITFDRASQEFVFTHTQRPGQAEPWMRSCAAPEARATFERLLHKRLRWFHEG